MAHFLLLILLVHRAFAGNSIYTHLLSRKPCIGTSQALETTTSAPIGSFLVSSVKLHHVYPIIYIHIIYFIIYYDIQGSDNIPPNMPSPSSPSTEQFITQELKMISEKSEKRPQQPYQISNLVQRLKLIIKFVKSRSRNHTWLGWICKSQEKIKKVQVRAHQSAEVHSLRHVFNFHLSFLRSYSHSNHLLHPWKF